MQMLRRRRRRRSLRARLDWINFNFRISFVVFGQRICPAYVCLMPFAVRLLPGLSPWLCTTRGVYSMQQLLLATARPGPARLHVVQDNAALETCLSNTYASIYVCIRACTCTHICTYVCVYICTCSNGLAPTQPHIMRMYRYISCVCQCVRLSFGYGFNLLHVSMTRGNKAMLTPPPSPTPTWPLPSHLLQKLLNILPMLVGLFYSRYKPC